MTRYRLLAAIATLALLPLAASALTEDATPLTACDLLAGHPSDPGHLGPGVSSSDADLDTAIPACRRAVAQYKDSPRLRYQLGRVMFYKAGRTSDAEMRAEAVSHIQAATEMGWTQASFVRGLIHVIDGDICAAMALYRKAAEEGLQAAQVQLAQQVASDAYTACDAAPSAGEARALLAGAKDGMSGFYEEMLWRDLDRQLADMAAQ